MVVKYPGQRVRSLKFFKLKNISLVPFKTVESIMIETYRYTFGIFRIVIVSFYHRQVQHAKTAAKNYIHKLMLKMGYREFSG